MVSLLAKYALVQFPGWVLAGLILWGAHIWMSMPRSLTIGLLIVWIVKDLLFFRPMRKFYDPDPVDCRLLQERGTAVTPLTPEGFVRVHGELWQARSDRHVEPGATVRVREICGLLLHVAPD